MSEQYLKRQLLVAYYYGCMEYARITGEEFPQTFKEFMRDFINNLQADKP